MKVKADMGEKYRTNAMAAVHQAMEALHRLGAISKQTMRQFDNACLAQSSRCPGSRLSRFNSSNVSARDAN